MEEESVDLPCVCPHICIGKYVAIDFKLSWEVMGGPCPMQPTIPGMAQKAEKSEKDVQRLEEENADSKERRSVASCPWQT